MSKLNNPVSYFYLFLIGFVLIVPVDSGFLIKFIAILFILFIWFLYFLGTSFSHNHNRISYNGFIKKPKNRLTILVLISAQFYSSIYAGSYYTGLGFSDVIQNIFSGNSNYAMYQTYFNTAGLGTFNINKLPAIFSFFYVKFIFIYFLYFFIVKKDRGYDSLIVFLSIIPMVILAAFRGTNFELFEILVALICSFYIKSRLINGYKFPFFRLISLAVLFVFVYVVQIMFRYNFEYSIGCSNAFCYDYDSLLHQFLPPISSAIYKLSAYFYFAPDYISRWFIYYLENKKFFTLFLPGNGHLYDYTGKWLCNKEFICGPTWAPDFEIFIYYLGFPLTVFLIVCLSYFQKYLQRFATLNFIDFLGFYIITLEIFAMPTGNFLFTSSANQLLLFSFITLFSIRLFSKNLTHKN